MISVCLVTYNGAKYIREQLESILVQLDESDEIIISDDGSTDATLKIINSFSDNRIKIFNHEKQITRCQINSVTQNVEFALKQCSGDYIFLSDQDDVWLPNKVSIMMQELIKSEIVLSNCKLVDSNLKILHSSFFELANTRVGVIKNIISSTYLGCCMAFQKKILERVFPFPSSIGHDFWIGIIGTIYFNVSLIDEPLLLYRRHNATVSTSGMKSKRSIFRKIYVRLVLIMELLKKILINI